MTNSELDQVAAQLDERRGQVLLQLVHKFLGRFVSYPCKHSHVAHTLWIIHTHLMDKWDSTPRLNFSSVEPGSGKSRALEVTETMVPRPIATVNVTSAYLFRKIGDEAGAPTILFDEIDTVFGPKAREANEEIRGLLNAGHRKGAVAGRCVMRGKTIETEELPAYAAVAMAGLGWLPDTILSRSITIRMRKRRPDERVEPYRPRIHEREGWALKAAIESWVAGFLDFKWPELPPEIQDRNADVWEPLIVIADAAGGDWPARARAAAVALVTRSKETEPSLGVRLLADIKVVFGSKDKMFTSDILSALNEIEEAPWGDIKGKPLDGRGLARRLKEYDIKSKTVRIGPTTGKGYDRADFLDMWARHLPESVTSVTSVTSPRFSAETRVTDGNGVTDVPSHLADTHAQKEPKATHVPLVTDVTNFQGKADRTCAQCQLDDGKTILFHTVPPRWLHVECEQFWSGRR
jgi:hypothetical protein